MVQGLPSDGSIGLSSLSIEQETIEAPLHPIFLHLHLGRHKDMIAALEFTLDGKNLITVSQDKTAILWDSSTGCFNGLNQQISLTFLVIVTQLKNSTEVATMTKCYS